MANVSFDLTPEELESCAKRLEYKSGLFTREYNAIYNAVADLSVTYRGEASQTFNKKIEGYRNDFLAAETALKNFEECLLQYAAHMRTVENELKSRAETLSVGK